jgi:Cu/Ag efflux protein CusF
MRKMSVMVASTLVLSGGMLASVTLAQAPMVNGQVTKIDEAAGKITLKHGPIKKLDMNEGMTMVFRVQEASKTPPEGARREPPPGGTEFCDERRRSQKR